LTVEVNKPIATRNDDAPGTDDTAGAKEVSMKRILTLSAATLLMSAATYAAVDSALTDRIADAATVLRELRSVPDKDIPEDLWSKAECVAVIPSVKKAAFVVGGEYGKGLISCRKGSTWSAPSFVLLGKGSVGFQIGASSTDLVLLVMNERGVKHLLEDKVALGAEATAAAGPVGRDARAMTDAQLKAEILSYSRSQGLFAGVDVTGGVLKADNDDNRELYGRKIGPREILVAQSVAPPSEARPFMRALARSSAAADNDQ
jgi:SH3 domain-containing YSC84-like protein 1